MIIHEWIQWEEVLRNKRHFYDFSEVVLWDLNAVKIGIHPQVNPVLVKKAAERNMAEFTEIHLQKAE